VFDMFVGVQVAVKGKGWTVREIDNYFYIFERKGCVKRTLYVNYLSL